MPIRQPTVFILGAGASVDFRFPLGVQLRNRVCEFCVERPNLLSDLGVPDDQVQHFRNELRYSGHRSVDVFIEHNPEFMNVGKACIAGALLPFENEDWLFPPGASSPNWYEYLANEMGAGTDRWFENKLSVVTFNYDRSFEHYFTRVIAQRRRLNLERAHEEFQACVRVVHVHGSLGDYSRDLSYGGPMNATALAAAAGRLLVVSEVADTLPTFDQASELLSSAKRILFFGFGFHPDNVRRLRFFNQPASDELAVVEGTNDGFTEGEWRSVCTQVLNGHWRSGRSNGVHDYLRHNGHFD